MFNLKLKNFISQSKRMVKLLTTIIDFFYFPVFKKIMPLKTFRYAACGGGNLILDNILYILFYYLVFQEQEVQFWFIDLKPHSASLFFVFPITFLTGFSLNKYITFEKSNIDGKTQFMRYFMVAMGAIGISFLLLKLFIEGIGIPVVTSKILTTIISVIYSYILQNKFTFKIEKES